MEKRLASFFPYGSPLRNPLSVSYLVYTKVIVIQNALTSANIAGREHIGSRSLDRFVRQKASLSREVARRKARRKEF